MTGWKDGKIESMRREEVDGVEAWCVCVCWESLVSLLLTTVYGRVQYLLATGCTGTQGIVDSGKPVYSLPDCFPFQ